MVFWDFFSFSSKENMLYLDMHIDKNVPWSHVHIPYFSRICHVLLSLLSHVVLLYPCSVSLFMFLSWCCLIDFYLTFTCVCKFYNFFIFLIKYCTVLISNFSLCESCYYGTSQISFSFCVHVRKHLMSYWCYQLESDVDGSCICAVFLPCNVLPFLPTLSIGHCQCWSWMFMCWPPNPNDRPSSPPSTQQQQQHQRKKRTQANLS